MRGATSQQTKHSGDGGTRPAPDVFVFVPRTTGLAKLQQRNVFQIMFASWRCRAMLLTTSHPRNVELATARHAEQLDDVALYSVCRRNLDIELYRLLARVSPKTASLRFFGALNVSIAAFQTNSLLFSAHSHVALQRAVTSTVKAYIEHWSVASSPCPFFSPLPFGQCALRRGKYVACCLVLQCVVVPKVVNVAVR